MFKPDLQVNTPEGIRSIAVRVHHMQAMTAFYSEAFGVKFREVQTGPFLSQFGELGGITLKFVPIREADDFEAFPIHQPGITVADIEAVIAIAIAHGGQQEGEFRQDEFGLRAAIRDPDGNTIELYSPKR